MKQIISFLILGAACLGWAENHALLIGIDEYKDSSGINRLKGAVNDVNDLAKVLEDSVGFKKENIKTLVGPQAEKLKIIDALDQLKLRTKPGDFVWFSFCGHGFQPADKAYLVPWDAVNSGSDAILQNSSLEATEVARLLGEVSADVLVASFDMCRSDPRVPSQVSAFSLEASLDAMLDDWQDQKPQSINAMSFAMARDLQVKTTNSGSGPRRVLRMFASSQGQRSWEMAGTPRGYFSYFLEKGLRGEASREGKVSVSSLAEYLEQEVIAAVRLDRHVEQRPEILSLGSQLLSYVLCTPQNPAAREQSDFDRLFKEALVIVGDRPLDKISEVEARTARGLLTKADQLKPGVSVIKWQLGRCEDKVGHLAEAEELYLKAIELDPANSGAHNNLGILKAKRGDSPGAEAQFRKAIELNRSNNFAYYNLGLLYKRLGKTEEAQVMFNKAIECNPKDSESYNSLGSIFLGQRADAEAEDMFRKSIDFDPTNRVPYGNLYRLLIAKRRTEEALKVRQKALANGIEIG